MSNGTKTPCTCARCRARGLMGPLMLIAVGGIFLAAEYTRFGWADLWPVLLIVAGVVSLVQSTASREGHIGS